MGRVAGSSARDRGPIAIAGVQWAVGTATSQTIDVDIGIGAAGAEVSVGILRLDYDTIAATIFSPQGMVLPVPLGGIGAGARVSLRARSTSGTGPTSWTLLYYQSFDSTQVTTSTQVLSGAPSGTVSATITPSATPWADSPWTELIAAAATEVGLLGLTHAPAAGVSADGYEYDLGVGAAGAETVLTTLREAAYGSARVAHTWLPGIYRVAAGTRIAVRLRKAGTSTAAHPVSLLYYTQPSATSTTGLVILINGVAVDVPRTGR